MNESLTYEERKRAWDRVWKKLLQPPTQEELERAEAYLAAHEGKPPQMGCWHAPGQVIGPQ